MQTSENIPVTPVTPVTAQARARRLPPLCRDRVFLFLAASAVAVLLLLLAVSARAAETASVHGLILESEMGAVLEADNGDIYFLEGPDMTSWYDTLATVTGALTRDEGGNLYLEVTGVTPDLEQPAPDSPGPDAAPLNSGHTLNTNSASGVS